MNLMLSTNIRSHTAESLYITNKLYKKRIDLFLFFAIAPFEIYNVLINNLEEVTCTPEAHHIGSFEAWMNDF